jgi:hypothetical protein
MCETAATGTLLAAGCGMYHVDDVREREREEKRKEERQGTFVIPLSFQRTAIERTAL